ncbi:hypothetical protein SGPA1_41102 [Streptomyces misionensis JCM 4497]
MSERCVSFPPVTSRLRNARDLPG